MANRTADFPAGFYARLCGFLYLLIILTAMFSESMVRSSLIASGDAAATAGNIMESQTLFRLGLTADMVNCLLDVAVAVILFFLLRPVHDMLALLAAVLRIVADTILGLVGLLHLSAIVILTSDQLTAFSPEQINASAYLALKLHGLGYNISLIFFGLGCCVLGSLIYRSGYLPKVIGGMLFVAGMSYLFNSFTTIIAPPLSKTLFPWPLLPGFFSELALCLWLMIKGIDLTKWPHR